MLSLVLPTSKVYVMSSFSSAAGRVNVATTLFLSFVPPLWAMALVSAPLKTLTVTTSVSARSRPMIESEQTRSSRRAMAWGSQTLARVWPTRRAAIAGDEGVLGNHELDSEHERWDPPAPPILCRQV